MSLAPIYCPRCGRRLGPSVLQAYIPDDGYAHPHPRQATIRVFKNGDWRRQTEVHVECATPVEMEAHGQRCRDVMEANRLRVAQAYREAEERERRRAMRPKPPLILAAMFALAAESQGFLGLPMFPEQEDDDVSDE